MKYVILTLGFLIGAHSFASEVTKTPCEQAQPIVGPLVQPNQRAEKPEEKDFHSVHERMSERGLGR